MKRKNFTWYLMPKVRMPKPNLHKILIWFTVSPREIL